MKHFRTIQGSQEWLRLRLGKPTASEFDRLITAKTHVPTKGSTRRAYLIYLLTELILDEPLSGVTTASMNHGKAYEENARSAYEMLIGKEIELCGFITNDEMTYGASPDSFVGEDGSLEIKCPFKPEIHVGYMMDNDSFAEEHFVQTQGQLFVTGRQWTDLISYVGTLPMVQVRVLPDPIFQEKLGVALKSFCAEFSDLVQRAVNMGVLQDVPPVTEWISAGDVEMVRKDRAGKAKPEGDFDVTDEDIARIWGMRKG